MIQALLVPDSTALLVGLCALVFLSSVLQTATGFGFAILSAPIGAALLGGPAAVGMVLITGTAVDVLILSLRRSYLGRGGTMELTRFGGHRRTAG